MGIIDTMKFAISPVIGLPVLFAIGSQSFNCTIAVFISIIVLLIYARTSIKSRNLQTKFFLSWVISSVIYLWILFVLTVKLDDFLVPREHYVLASITFGAMLFFHLVKLLRKISFIQLRKKQKNSEMLESFFIILLLKGKTKGKKKDISS